MQTWIPDAWRFPDAEQLGGLRIIASQVAEYLDTVRGQRSPVRKAEFDFVFGDASVILAITGDRGGGKSSLLALLCRHLLNVNRDFVLPPLRPEFFSETDTLVSAFSSSLWSILANDREGGPGWLSDLSSEARLDLSQQCLAAARSYAVSRTPSAAINANSTDPLDFADEALVVSRSIARSQRDLAELVDSLLSYAPGGSQPLVMLPVDDADLAPAQVGRILHDLRFIGSLPGVVPIACFDFDDLRSGWLSTRSNGVTETNIRTLSERFERELEKLIPPRARFSIPALSVARRQTFVPIGESESVGDRWRDLVRRFESLVKTKTSLAIVVEETSYPLGLESPLPSTPRSLIQLWEAAMAPQVDGSAHDGGEIVRLNRAISILAAPLRNWCADNRIREPRVTLEAESYHEIGLGPPLDAQVQLPDTTLGIAADRVFEETVTDDAHTERVGITTLRGVHRLYIDVLRETAERPAGRPPPAERVRLPAVQAGALLALQDFAIAASPTGSDRTAYVGVDEWRFLQRTGTTTDSPCETIAMLPTGATLGEVGGSHPDLELYRILL